MLLSSDLSYAATDNRDIRLQANNLTNEEIKICRDNDRDRLGRYDKYGASYLFDITYSF